MAIRPMEIGLSPALVGRITFITGDLGYEIWMKPAYQLAVYDTLLDAGEDLEFSATSAAGRSTRCAWRRASGSFTREYTPDYTRSRPAWSASWTCARTTSSDATR